MCKCIPKLLTRPFRKKPFRQARFCVNHGWMMLNVTSLTKPGLISCPTCGRETTRSGTAPGVGAP